eukprot:gene30578-33419_t
MVLGMTVGPYDRPLSSIVVHNLPSPEDGAHQVLHQVLKDMEGHCQVRYRTIVLGDIDTDPQTGALLTSRSALVRFYSSADAAQAVVWASDKRPKVRGVPLLFEQQVQLLKQERERSRQPQEDR